MNFKKIISTALGASLYISNISSTTMAEPHKVFPIELNNCEYDLKYNGLKFADVYLNFKRFESGDISSELEKFLDKYPASDLFTMEFSFDIVDVPFVREFIQSFYDSASFKTVGIVLSGEVRPVLSIVNSKEGSDTYEVYSFYNRHNYTITTRKKSGEDIRSDYFEPDVFKDILDPLSIIVELVTTKPTVGESELNVGFFYTPNVETCLFPIKLNLIRTHKEWNGEIRLPAGVFLEKDSIFVRNQYAIKGDELVPGIKKKLYLKPVSGLASLAPGWAYTVWKK